MSKEANKYEVALGAGGVLQTEVKFNPGVLQPWNAAGLCEVSGAFIPRPGTPVGEAGLRSREVSPAHCLKISLLLLLHTKASAFYTLETGYSGSRKPLNHSRYHRLTIMPALDGGQPASRE